MILEGIGAPSDLEGLTDDDLRILAEELRALIVETVCRTGGHLGSNLGAVELTIALHKVFHSPSDIILWDTGHQAYVHKLLTGRRAAFSTLRQEGGLSGYPSRAESEHDWVESSHASAILSYAHGLASALDLGAGARVHGAIGAGAGRHVVAVVGDGALTGGMAYEALNNLGHSGKQVIIILNDNGRSYAPTVSKLSESLTQLRLSPSYVQMRERGRDLLRRLPAVGNVAYSGVHGITSALREAVTPHTFFEALGVRYAGPIDGHDISRMELAFSRAMSWQGPILVHLLTDKGRGYPPAEQDEVQRLHDFKVRGPASGDHPTSQHSHGDASSGTDSGSMAPSGGGHALNGGEAQDAAIHRAAGADAGPAPGSSYTEVFTETLLSLGERHPDLVAITAAMPGPTGLLAFQERFPERFFDVGIAEQHALTAAAGMAMGGLRPVVAIYSTFFSRAFDQANMDIGLHGLPVLLVLDRAGITGDDGPSHHGIVDLALTLAIPGMTVFAPSSAEELAVMLETAITLDGPSAIRFPKTPARHVATGEIGSGLSSRKVATGDGSVCILAVGKMLERSEVAVELLESHGVRATLWDVRVVSPADQQMIRDAAGHDVVVTVEDGIRVGGAGSHLADAVSTCASGDGRAVPVRALGVPLAYIPHAKPDKILADLGLDGAGIARSVQEVLSRFITAGI